MPVLGARGTVWGIVTAFETVARFTNTVVGGGTNNFGAAGNAQTTSATGTSSSKCLFPIEGNGAGATDAWQQSPLFASKFRGLSFGAAEAGNNGSYFVGMGNVTVDGSGHTFTVRHVGFKVVKTDGVSLLYGTQADGTTENASASLIGTIATNNDIVEMIAKANGTTSVDYYTRKNGAALSAATNLTSNFPSDNGSGEYLQVSVSNNATAFQFAPSTVGFFYEH